MCLYFITKDKNDDDNNLTEIELEQEKRENELKISNMIYLMVEEILIKTIEIIAEERIPELATGLDGMTCEAIQLLANLLTTKTTKKKSYYILNNVEHIIFFKFI